jgi:hypothetical protein
MYALVSGGLTPESAVPILEAEDTGARQKGDR